MRTSKKEITDLLKAWSILSLAFAIILVGFQLTINFLFAIITSSLTVGLGFLLHELAHKLLAQKYGCFAEFRSNDKMLILALLMSFVGFIFVAPGGVFINGHVGTTRNGKISAAGIGTNLILASIFLPLLIITKSNFTFYGFFVNTWLALFNLIPVGNFDGLKVLKWNKSVYSLMVVFAIIFMIFQAYMAPL